MGFSLLGSVTSVTSDTSTGTISDITDMTVTADVAGTGSVILILAVVSLDLASDETVEIVIDIDGVTTTSPEMVGFVDAAGEGWTPTIVQAVDGLSAASHTFKLRWITGENGVAGSTSTDRARSLVVVELEAADASLLVDIDAITADTLSASWTNIDDLAATPTVTASSMHIFLTSLILETRIDEGADIQFAVGGARDGPLSSIFSDSNDETAGLGLIWAQEGIASGSQTLSVQAQRRVGASAITSDDQRRNFQVIEVIGNFNVGVDIESVSSEADPATWANQDAMSGSFTVDGTNSVVLMFACGIIDTPDTNDHTSEFMLADGGAREGPQVATFADGTSLITGHTLAWAKDSISGSHTFSLQWQAIAGSGATDTGRERTLQVIDLKGAAAGGRIMGALAGKGGLAGEGGIAGKGGGIAA